MAAVSQNCLLFFSGVIQNGDELECEIGRCETGPRIVVRAWERWGWDLARMLRGAYALVLVDPASKRGLCTRDPMGTHPLFWSGAGPSRIFSPSIDALRRHPKVSSGINRVAAVNHLRDSWPDPSETFFAEIHRLPPGYRMCLENGRWRTERYWLTEDGAEMPQDTDLDRFEPLFERAVRRSTRGVRPAIFLSGGLDSVAVAGVASDLARDARAAGPHTLSLGFPGDESDVNEQAIQSGVARRLALSQDLLPFADAAGPGGLLAAAIELSPTLGSPLLNTWLPAYSRLAGLGAARGHDVILTGTGGDEWLGVSPLLAADFLAAGRFRDLLALARFNARSFRNPKGSMLGALLWTFGLRPVLRARAVGWLDGHAPSWMSARRQKRIEGSLGAWLAPDPSLRAEAIRRIEQSDHAADQRGGSHYVGQMRTALDSAVVSWEFEEMWDHYGRLGVRMAHPFCDPDLIEFLYRIDPAVLVQSRRTKGPLRAMLESRFPDLGFSAQRKVDGVHFLRRLFRAELPGVWRRLGGIQALVELGVVCAGDFEKHWNRNLESATLRQLHRMWSVLNFEAWIRPRR
ncbi:MAG: asparagine synthase-related protein [Bryobacteraceae bacterium]